MDPTNTCVRHGYGGFCFRISRLIENFVSGHERRGRARPQSQLPASHLDTPGLGMPSPDTPNSFRSDSQLQNGASQPLPLTPSTDPPLDPYVVHVPRSGVSFEWSVPSNHYTKSHIRDSAGNPLYTIKSPTRRTVISDEYGDVVAKVKWSTFSKPTIRLNRDIPMRVKDWIRFSYEDQYALPSFLIPCPDG